MRLLNVNTLKLEEFYGRIPDYVILSHRWGDEEVTFKDMSGTNPKQRKGWEKVKGCCDLALKRGHWYAWIDTCCIDKSSSAELTEAINSMYTWYKNAVECYAYLADVSTLSRSDTSRSRNLRTNLNGSNWFTRGWTLQELIAPISLIFYDAHWLEIGSRYQLRSIISGITNIGSGLLEGRTDVADYSIAQRMAWAADRTTARIEDEAYSLLGIFQVNMPMLYGEGKNAFQRLQEAIIKDSDDQTLFAWHDERKIKPVLAPSAACFRGLHDLKSIYATNNERSGHTVSNAGLSIELMLIPWAMNVYVAPLSCGVGKVQEDTSDERHKRGYNRTGIFLSKTAYRNHLIRVSVPDIEAADKTEIDSILLDSDVVAKKRKAFRIQNRQVFVRQTLIDPARVLSPSFTFDFAHLSLFKSTNMPWFGGHHFDLHLKFNDRENLVHGSSENRYHHTASVKLWSQQIIQGSPNKPLYFYFGFDLDFVPVCLVSTLSELLNSGEQADFKGMHTSGGPGKAPLAWLLEQIDNDDASTTIFAFKANGIPPVITECPDLDLKMSFELKTVPDELPGTSPIDTWHVTLRDSRSMAPTPTIYTPLSSIPPTPRTTRSRRSFRSAAKEVKLSNLLDIFAILRRGGKGAESPNSSPDVANFGADPHYTNFFTYRTDYLSPESAINRPSSPRTIFATTHSPAYMLSSTPHTSSAYNSTSVNQTSPAYNTRSISYHANPYDTTSTSYNSPENQPQPSTTVTMPSVVEADSRMINGSKLLTIVESTELPVIRNIDIQPRYARSNAESAAAPIHDMKPNILRVSDL